MPRVVFARHLQRLLPLPPSCEIASLSVAEAVRELDARYPGLASYLVLETGQLRPHVNIFIGERWLRDREQLSDALVEEDEVTIMPALSGG